MNSITNIILTAAIATALSLGAAQADEQTMKPLQGASFHAGSKHAVVYFLNDKATCKVVLTVADDANYAPSRIEAAIADGSSTHYQFAEGQSLEFGCHDHAQILKVNALKDVATNG